METQSTLDAALSVVATIGNLQSRPRPEQIEALGERMRLLEELADNKTLARLASVHSGPLLNGLDGQSFVDAVYRIGLRLYGLARVLAGVATDGAVVFTPIDKDKVSACWPKYLATLKVEPMADTLQLMTGLRWEFERVGDAKPEKAKRRLTVEDRMKAEMLSNLETVKGWTAQQWADCLGCGKTTVIGAPTWKSLSLLRQQLKAEKRRDRHGTKRV